MNKNILFVFLILILSFFTFKPLLHSGFFPVHDNVQVERVYVMGQALKDGQFPVRMVSGLGYGYGYPIFNFYAPLPYYVGGIFSAVGVDTIVATKIMYFLGTMLAGILMFFLAKEFWGVSGGLLSAVLYSYSPYHALDIYVRGAVGEFWAYAFIPLVFLSFYKLAQQKNSYRWIIWGALGLCGVVLSHNLTAFMLVPFIVIYLFLLIVSSKPRKILILNSCFLILISLLLSAFYWLPALIEMGYTNVSSQIGGGADFHKHFIYPTQIWDFPWGFGGSAGLESGISYKIGKLNIILWAAGLFILIYKFKKTKAERPVLLICIVGFILAVFLTNSLSVGIWELIKPMSYIQYPWRFLIMAVFFSSLLSGYFFDFVKGIKSTFSKILLVILIMLVIIFQTKYFQPQQYTLINSKDLTNEEHLNWNASKISDEYLPVNFPVIQKQKEILNHITARTDDPLFISKRIENTSMIKTFTTLATASALLTLPLADFPGWHYFVNDIEVNSINSHLASFTIPKGSHTISAKFSNTPIRSFANPLSLLGLVFLGVIIRKIAYEKNK